MHATEYLVIAGKYPALTRVIFEDGIVPSETRVVHRATVEDVRDKTVVGILPLHLAAETDKLIIADLHLPVHLRNTELSTFDIRRYLQGWSEYEVGRRRIDPAPEPQRRSSRRPDRSRW